MSRVESSDLTRSGAKQCEHHLDGLRGHKGACGSGGHAEPEAGAGLQLRRSTLKRSRPANARATAGQAFPCPVSSSPCAKAEHGHVQGFVSADDLGDDCTRLDVHHAGGIADDEQGGRVSFL